MSNLFWNVLKFSPAAIGAALVLSNPAVANELNRTDALSEPTVAEMPELDSTTTSQTTVDSLEQIDRYVQEADSMAQVTSVSQLRDVQPTDWAFQALQSLVERYGCIAGYPDGTFRGNRPLTRYEFAAGLNACLDRITELIGGEDGIGREDLATIRRLQEEFQAELATLRGRVDALEARTAELEANQFSTTAKLSASVLFNVADTFGDDNVFNPDDENDNTQTTFSHRVRLNFESSFTGKDKLRARLETGNTPELDEATGTEMARLAYEAAEDNIFKIDELWYRFPVGDRLTVQIDADNGEFYDMLISAYSPNESSTTGALSRFGRFNPILRQGSGGAGINIDYRLADALGVTLGYLAPDAENPNEKFGLFNGSYAAIGQVNFDPGPFGLGLTYIRSFYPGGEANFSGSAGSALAKEPFGDVATSGDTFGAQAELDLGSAITLSGWFGWSNAQAESDGLGVNDGDEADIINWAGAVSFPDLLGKGNMASVIFGQPPKVTDSDVVEDDDTSYLLEAFYRFKVNDRISLQPGGYVIFNPEHDDDNDELWVATLRTIFKF